MTLQYSLTSSNSKCNDVTFVAYEGIRPVAVASATFESRPPNEKSAQEAHFFIGCGDVLVFTRIHFARAERVVGGLGKTKICFSGEKDFSFCLD